MTVVTRGDKELALRFDAFPARARDKLEARIRTLVERLEARVETAAPRRTGALASEITSRVYGNQPDRIAGYVSVYAPGAPRAYGKAATLEYGSNKGRRIFARSSSGRRRVVERVTKPVRIRAARFLRGPLEEMRPEIEAELNDALADTAAEEST
ncbi:MAG TPA: hypothetical protein VFB54_17725 [Burkholderiales bacterium]|nr:hypothetical protein [Burkholderiales bacterium]